MAELHHQDCPIQLETGLDLLPDSSQNHSSFSLLVFPQIEILTWTWISCETSVHHPLQAQECSHDSCSSSLTCVVLCSLTLTCASPCCLSCSDISSSSSAPRPPLGQSALETPPCLSWQGFEGETVIVFHSQVLLSSSELHPACLWPIRTGQAAPSPLGLLDAHDWVEHRRAPLQPKASHWVAAVGAV